MKKILFLFLLIAFSCNKTSNGIEANTEVAANRQINTTEILVKFKTPSADIAAINSVKGQQKEKIHTQAMKRFGDHGFFVITVPDVSGAVEALKHNPNIEWVSPNYKVDKIYTPNDPYYTDGSLWGMTNINAPTAWNTGNLGSQSIFVGVIDQGIDYTHPDLCGQIWTNPYDPVDGIDNDGNGYVDDRNGYDFYNKDITIFDNADNHGTHVAGTIGGIGNNGLGVIGVASNITIIGAKFLGPQGGYTSDAILAIDYCTDLTLRHSLDLIATNNSWGGGGYSQGLFDAIERSKNANILFIAAAGNNGDNNDVLQSYPASYSNANIISVAAITSDDAIAAFSNYGATSVDIAAPGSGIWSTISTLSANYASYSGTSMATPHVTGAAVLYKTGHPGASYSQIKNGIMSTARPSATLSGKCVTGGILNVASFAGVSPTPVPRGCSQIVDNQPPSAPVLSVGDITSSSITINWPPSTDNVSVSYYWFYFKPSSSSTYTAAATNANIYQKTGLQAATSYDFYAQAVDANGNVSSPSNTLTVSTLGTIQPPPPAISVSANPSGSMVGQNNNLSWNINAVGSPIQQVLLQVRVNNGPYSVIHSAPASSIGSFSHSVTQKVKYDYQLYVVLQSGDNTTSNTVTLNRKGGKE